MMFVFAQKDDYDIVIPAILQKAGNDFKALVDKSFNDDDLIFCLIEQTTLSDIDAIGETYLYSIHSKEQGKKILEKYEVIVNKVKEKYNKGISEFLDWYRKQSFVLIFNNGINYRFPTPKPNWEQDISSQVKQKDRAKYANSISDFLEDTIIKEYLEFYAKLLYNEFGFSTYPHFCIIVRPISAIEGETVIPLGNLYLHFATMNEKDEDFYKRLITEFLVVWFKRKGVKIIQEIKQDTINKYVAEMEKCSYLPIISHLDTTAKEKFTRKLTPSNKSIKDFYDNLYNDNTETEKYEKILNDMSRAIIPLFSELKGILNQFDVERQVNRRLSLSEYATNKSIELPRFYSVIESLNITGKFWSKQGQAHLKKTDADLNCFINILLRREIFKIGFILFGIDKNIMVNLIRTGNIDLTQTTSDSDYTALWTEIFIPWSKTLKTNELQQNIYKSNSDKEKAYYQNYQTIKDEQ